MGFLRDTGYLLLRLLRATVRMPVFVLISIVQPILWVLLFGQLFNKVTTIQGFGASSYVQFLAPGISIMTALFGAAYSGMGMLADIDRGVLDRLLATPVARGALVAARILHSAFQVVIQAGLILIVACLLGARPQGGLPGLLTLFLAAALLGPLLPTPVARGALIAARILHSAFQVVIQAALILVVSCLLGARPQGGLAGLLTLFLAAALLGGAFAAFSNALALAARKQELVIAVMNFVVLPTTFLSSMIISRNLMPAWIRTVSLFNPVNWAVTAARDGFQGEAPREVALCLGLLAAFALACGLLATLSFRRYRRAM